MQFDGIFVFDVTAHALVEADHVGTKFAGFINKDLMKIGAMHLRVRRAILALVFFRQRKLLDDFARVVQAKHISAGTHAYRVDGRAKAKITQDVLGVGANLDASADLAQLLGLLVDFDVVAGLHEAGRGGKSA